MTEHRCSVAVVGATGITGGFAFDAAEARGLAPLAVGRNVDKLRTFLAARRLGPERMRVADVHDGPALRRALQDSSVVISAVAPFSDNGYTVARTAAEMGLGYTDSSGEGGFMCRLIDELDALATRTGATLCTGNGVAAAMGDIAMHWLTDRSSDSRGAVLYDIRDYQPTAGTMRSYLAHILPAGGGALREGQLKFFPMAAFGGEVAGVAGFHSVVPDALVISRYWKAQRLDALFRAPVAVRPFAAGMIRALLWQPIRRGLLKLPLDRWMKYDPAAGERSTVFVLAWMCNAAGETRQRVLRGRAIYPLTGAILAATAEAMLLNQARPAGVRASSEMFASYEEALRLTGLEELPSLPAR